LLKHNPAIIKVKIYQNVKLADEMTSAPSARQEMFSPVFLLQQNHLRNRFYPQGTQVVLKLLH
jgi:hypothetical protein